MHKDWVPLDFVSDCHQGRVSNRTVIRAESQSLKQDCHQGRVSNRTINNTYPGSLRVTVTVTVTFLVTVTVTVTFLAWMMQGHCHSLQAWSWSIKHDASPALCMTTNKPHSLIVHCHCLDHCHCHCHVHGYGHALSQTSAHTQATMYPGIMMIFYSRTVTFQSIHETERSHTHNNKDTLTANICMAQEHCDRQASSRVLTLSLFSIITRLMRSI